MPIRELLTVFLQNNDYKLSKAESLLLEAKLFVRVTDEFCEMISKQYQNYQKLIKNELTKEDEMIEKNFLRFLVNDIISTNEYTLEGIANFVRMPIDVLVEIVSGLNTNPSLTLASKIIKLHCDVRRDLYSELLKRVIERHAA